MAGARDVLSALKVSTIARRLASIIQAHRAAGHPSPTNSARAQAVGRIGRMHGAGVE